VAITAALAAVVSWMAAPAVRAQAPSPPPHWPEGSASAPAEPEENAVIPPRPSGQEIIRRVDNDDMRIALTFDACATRTNGYGFDRPVYMFLQRERIPATIFVSGRWVESHPAVMKRLAVDPLIEFANHSYDHPHMTVLSDDDISAQFDRTEAALGRYGQHSVAFRPPFGIFDDRVLEIARGKQLPPVLWDVVSGDPSRQATVETITRAVLGETRSGSIVIFHINGRATRTASALPGIVGDLRARGFRFVHVSTLLSSAGSPRRPVHATGDEVLPLGPPEIQVALPVRVTHQAAPATSACGAGTGTPCP
jgi:peptidoglycan/xylan/chitin deacetylase (PgdA/CDA1 family)